VVGYAIGRYLLVVSGWPRRHIIIIIIFQKKKTNQTKTQSSKASARGGSLPTGRQAPSEEKVQIKSNIIARSVTTKQSL